MEMWSFSATLDPPASLVAGIAASVPENVFYTPAYARTNAELGARVCALAVREGPRLAGCLGFLRRGRIWKTLEIPSVPDLEPDAVAPFWEGVRAFCTAHRISTVSLDSFGSRSSRIIAFGTVVEERDRVEHLLDLQAPEGLPRISSNHTRNAKRARKLGLVVERSRDPALARSHVTMMQESMQRRAERGESVPLEQSIAPVAAYLRCGAAELFQVYDGTELRSSLLLLRAERGAYYQSAGTSPEGMQQGASHLLMTEIIQTLQAEGLLHFNLGGAGPDNPGLQRFKEGFKGRTVPLQAMQCDLRPALLRKLHTAAQLVRNDPGALLQALVRAEPFVVYAAEPARIGSANAPAPGITVRPLSDDELRGLAADPEMKEQADRFERLGYNAAFGVFADGTLAHVAWLITPEHDRRTAVRNVRLREGEAEITHCLSHPRVRGQGIYPTAIRALCRIAAERGIRQVFMITNVHNAASRRGIEKAGLHRQGAIVRFAVGPGGERLSLTYRGHRLPRVHRVLSKAVNRLT